uniref:Uncharacterized protein n=1 Tax=Anguilla anguilla TaxID=7936 RepID=A0A0E9XTA6_ANGAN
MYNRFLDSEFVILYMEHLFEYISANRRQCQPDQPQLAPMFLMFFVCELMD